MFNCVDGYSSTDLLHVDEIEFMKTNFASLKKTRITMAFRGSIKPKHY